MEKPNYQKWKQLQSHWDDDDFLKSLTPLMKLRYRRLDEKVEAILGENFRESGADKGRPFSWTSGRAGASSLFFYTNRGGKRFGIIWGWSHPPSN